MGTIILNEIFEDTDNVYNTDIRMPDKKYFHKTEYALRFKDIFGIDLQSNAEQFDLTYNTYKTLFKVYKSSITYKQNKIDRYNAVRNTLEEYFNIVKSRIKKCWDKYCIELYDEFEKWYDELLEMEQKKRYNFQNIIDCSSAFITSYDLEEHLTIDDSDLNRKIDYNDETIYQIKRQLNFDYNKDEYECHSNFLKRFKKKYRQELTLKEYSCVMDTLTIIIYIQNHIDNKEGLKKGINAYLKDYQQRININNDFDTNYDILNFIHQSNDMKVIQLMIKSLLQKNIYFLEELVE